MDQDRKALITEKLEECKKEIETWETKTVASIDSGEFKGWKGKVAKWLQMGGSATSEDLAKFNSLPFFIVRSRLFGARDYDSKDQQEYLEHLKLARQHMDSAIENLQLGLQYETPRTGQRSDRDAVNVSIVNINSMTVSDMVQLMQKQIESMPNSPDKKSLMEKLGEIAKSPLFTTLANTALGELAKKYSTGGG